MERLPTAAEIELELISEVSACSNDPLRYVLFAFPWGQGELAKHSGPEQWQRDLLIDIRDGLKNIDEVIQLATASGHGIGKSALVSWLILWALSTYEDTRGVVTANTEVQLRTKTWPELSVWYNRCVNKHWFKLTATAIFSVVPGHEKTWRFDAIPWSVTRTESFAGLHNKGKRIVVIFDEASAIDDAIWEVTQGALTDEDTQIIWAVFGNPTRNTGMFRECWKKFRHRWKTRQVDSREVSITNKAKIQQWIDDYGIDSDYVKVRVRGIFPSAGDKQFISQALVDAARGRHLDARQFNFAPVIIGVDPQWSGDDEGVVYLRQGLMSKKLMSFRKVEDDFIIAGHVARLEDEHQADAVFIDLGYGTGIFSAGKQLGRKWRLVSFGAAAIDPGFLNKRIEMWNDMKNWLKEGGALEDDQVICDELIAPEAYVVQTGKNTGKIFMESKEDLKDRGVSSPNRADALALTFAFPVLNKSQKQYKKLVNGQINQYDPLKGSRRNQPQKYDPLSPLAQRPRSQGDNLCVYSANQRPSHHRPHRKRRPLHPSLHRRKSLRKVPKRRASHHCAVFVAG